MKNLINENLNDFINNVHSEKQLAQSNPWGYLIHKHATITFGDTHRGSEYCRINFFTEDKRSTHIEIPLDEIKNPNNILKIIINEMLAEEE